MLAGWTGWKGDGYGSKATMPYLDEHPFIIYQLSWCSPHCQGGWKLGRPKTPLAVLFTGDEKYEMDACSLWLWVIVQSGTRKRLRWRMEAPYLYICINRPPTNKNIWNIHKYTGNHRVYISILSLQLGHALSPGLRPSAPWHSCAGSASKNETCSLPDLRTNTILDENGKIIFWKVYIYIYIYTHWTCP